MEKTYKEKFWWRLLSVIFVLLLLSGFIYSLVEALKQSESLNDAFFGILGMINIALSTVGELLRRTVIYLISGESFWKIKSLKSLQILFILASLSFFLGLVI